MVEQMFPPLSDDGGHMNNSVTLADEEEKVRKRKRMVPAKFYESWAAEASNRQFLVEDDQEIQETNGTFNCCSYHSSICPNESNLSIITVPVTASKIEPVLGEHLVSKQQFSDITLDSYSFYDSEESSQGEIYLGEDIPTLAHVLRRRDHLYMCHGEAREAEVS